MVLPVKLAAKLEFQVGNFKRDADEARGAVGRLKGALEVDLLGAMKAVLVGATALGVGLVGIGTAAVKASFDLNRGMADVASLMPGNTKRVLELKTAVQQLSMATGQSTEDIAKGLYSSLSAWGDTADTVKRLGLNADLATAGVATLEEAVSLTSAVTRAYGDTTLEATQKVADLSAMTVALGQTRLPDLAGAIGKVTGSSAELGISQEELFGVFATATGVIGGAAETSTGYAGILQALMSPTESMTELMQDLGFETAKEMLESEKLGGALKLVAEAAEESGKPLTDYISSQEGMRLALFLSGKGADDYAEKTEKLTAAEGANAAAVKEQREGIAKTAVTWDQLKASATVALQKIGDAIAPHLQGPFEAAIKAIKANSDAIAKFVGDAIHWVAKVLIPAIGGDSTAMKELKTGLEGVWSSIAGSLSRTFDTVIETIKVKIRNLLAELPGASAIGIDKITGHTDVFTSPGVPTTSQHTSYEASGGWISGPGGPTSDLIPAMLSNGEFVMNARAAKKFGPLLEAMNAKGYAEGGPVGSDPFMGGKFNADLSPQDWNVPAEAAEAMAKAFTDAVNNDEVRLAFRSLAEGMHALSRSTHIAAGSVDEMFPKLKNATALWEQMQAGLMGTIRGAGNASSLGPLNALQAGQESNLKFLEFIQATSKESDPFLTALGSMTAGVGTLDTSLDSLLNSTRAVSQAQAAAASASAQAIQIIAAAAQGVGGPGVGGLSQLEQQARMAASGAGGALGQAGTGTNALEAGAAAMAGGGFVNPWAARAAQLASEPWMNHYATQAAALSGGGGAGNVYLDGQKVGSILQGWARGQAGSNVSAPWG